jgi:hypothetical protein
MEEVRVRQDGRRGMRGTRDMKRCLMTVPAHAGIGDSGTWGL